MTAPGRSVLADRPAAVFRIGEVAKLTGLTTRTLRYWEELGLVRPSEHGDNGERRYAAADMTRVARVRDLQQLLGFSLAEVRAVLDTEEVDVLDRVRSELRTGDPSPARRRELLFEAIVANDHLLARLDDTLARIEAFRAERAATATRLRARLDELAEDLEPPSRPDDWPVPPIAGAGSGSGSGSGTVAAGGTGTGAGAARGTGTGAGAARGTARTRTRKGAGP